MSNKIGTQVQSIMDKSAESFEIIKGLSFNYRDTINRIYFYKNDKFVDCNDPSAIFLNLVKPYIMHFAKNIDLDPKDFRAIARGKAKYFQTWVLNTRFRKWANDSNLSVKIDDLTQLVSEFGSFVWKLTKNEAGEDDVAPCDLRHLYFDPTVKTVRDTNMVEMHYLTAEEIRAKKGTWDNTEEIIEMATENTDQLENKFQKKEVWEFTGYVKDEKTEKNKYMHIIGAGFGDTGVIAFEEEIALKDNKYFDFHLDKYSGGWLRKGAYEMNFILQERANTVVNENADATSIASLLLLRSEDPNTEGNVLKGAVSGQIINSSDLQQIGIDNRAANLLLGELDRIEAQVRKNLMLPDVATGEALPSGTTFRGQAISTNAYKSAFRQMRNRIAEPLKDIIQDRIMPSLIKGWNREDILELSGSEDDILMYDDAVKERRKIELLKEMNSKGIALEPGQLEALDEETDLQLGRVGRKVKLEKNFFDFDYGFIIDPTGETYDKAQQNDALINAIELTAANPAVADIPAFTQLLENNGITTFKLKPEQKQAIQEGGQVPKQDKQQDQLLGQVDSQ